jgi:hypothetical protein
MEERRLSEIMRVPFPVRRMTHFTIDYIEAISPFPAIEMDRCEHLWLIGIKPADLHVSRADIRWCRS